MDISEKKIDVEETPQSRQRKKHAKEREERLATVKEEKTWYVRVNGKILKKVLMTNGNTHTSLVCMDNKKQKAIIEKLKSDYPSQTKGI